MARGPRRALLGLAALLLGGAALLLTVVALDDALIALGDRRATATVLEVGALQRSRSGLHYEVRLRVPLPEGPPLEAWADRALKVTGGWSDPPRRPVPGDAIAVYVGADPPRIVPAAAVGSLWGWIAPLGFAWALLAGLVFAWRQAGRGG